MDEQQTVIYPAKIVRTMDPAVPEAEAVAVRGDRIRAIGSLAELRAYPGTVVDDRYADDVLLPGFVEAHSHAGSGGMWEHIYVGRFDRTDPDGRLWPGCATVADILERLRTAEQQLPVDPGVPLLAWALDPIYYPGQAVLARELDTVSTARPVHVLHANGHLAAVNSAALKVAGVDRDTQVEGVVKHADGTPTGELREWAAMSLVQRITGGGITGGITAAAIRAFGQDAVNTGTTTVTDLGTLLLASDESMTPYLEAVSEDFPARLSVFHFGAGNGTLAPAEAAARLAELRERSTGKLRMGHVKLMLDGSIQGFTARLQEPGYLDGRPNGIWTVSPAEFETALSTYHRAGLLVHVHCNGDQATELFLNTMEKVLVAHPRPDHRHTVTHAQMTTPAQYKRMAALGMCANIFANHIWAWGDQHIDITVGPDRAARMNATATALRCGVPFSLHCDTPVTPLSPLRTVKHAVTRRTVSGRVMGEHERITAEQALEAVTLGGAYLLKMDHQVGSLEPGKLADLAVLGADPLAVPAEEIGEIAVRGTVVGGTHHTSAVHRSA
ncbi:amidohydrolase [Streptomyces sp. B-S-A8]|uniref:Amidohydrolase n=1 Tax=Streptomyces solicavernae TaxID=3043614 RepID=A0ABT6RT81_9ACTN|nr:amidohydrolase [Streptomyces sp. B-S-A8]MDI3387643.1 amidohydrolase [Streptomyces sp. B-S-A8]